MTISKELFLGKELNDGSYPVLIRITHQGKVKRISTSVRCRKKDWDASRNCIASSDRHFKLKNETVEALFRRIAGQIQKDIDRHIYDNLEAMISPFKKFKSSKNETMESSSAEMTFVDLIDRKIEATVSLNTRRGYESFKRYFSAHFDRGPLCTEISQSFANKFLETMEKCYSGKDAMRNLIVSKFKTLVNFGKECGVISSNVKINLPKYRFTTKDRNLNTEEVYYIFSAFNKAISKDRNLKKTRTMALALFILDMAFQGLAPVDLAMLKVGSLNYKTLYSIEKNPKKYISDPKYKKEYDREVESIESVIINTVRKKTGQPVNIVSALAPIASILEPLTKKKNKEDYLIPCIDKSKNYSPTQRQNKLANFFNKMAKNLNESLDDYYEEHNLGQRDRISYYFARHAFCNCVDSLDVPRNLIQSMVGHKNTVLETSYLRSVSHWEQAMVSRNLFNLFI